MSNASARGNRGGPGSGLEARVREVQARILRGQARNLLYLCGTEVDGDLSQQARCFMHRLAVLLVALGAQRDLPGTLAAAGSAE